MARPEWIQTNSGEYLRIGLLTLYVSYNAIEPRGSEGGYTATVCGEWTLKSKVLYRDREEAESAALKIACDVITKMKTDIESELTRHSTTPAAVGSGLAKGARGMGWQIVLQPNGLLARFSDVVDDFTNMNMTVDEAIHNCGFHGLGALEARDKVRRGQEAGLDRWEESVKVIKRLHGKARYKEVMDNGQHGGHTFAPILPIVELTNSEYLRSLEAFVESVAAYTPNEYAYEEVMRHASAFAEQAKALLGEIAKGEETA